MRHGSRGRVATRPAPGSRGARVALVAALALVAAGVRAGEPTCAVLDAVPEGGRLAAIPVDAARPELTLTYLHSVTRTPVVETYRVDAHALTQTAIRFSQHGPGLPTQAGPGETWRRRDGYFEVTMARTFAGIRMRVHADQRPTLDAGETRIDLARWGNRALDLRVAACGSGAS